MAAQHREAAQAQGAVLAPEPHEVDNGPTSTGTPADGSIRAPLSCTRIMDAALCYIDHNCLGELSMRRLGSELGVEAMSLYRYFPSKGALLDAVAQRLLADLSLPAPDTGIDWEAQVRAYGWSFRTITMAHPNLMPLLGTMSPSEPPLSDIHGRMVRLWNEAGFELMDAERAQRALKCYLSGSSQWHRSSCAGGNVDADFAFGLDALLDGFRPRLLVRLPA
ncbi:MAG: TetR/AcrR family transcriptional regulator C-terminal domain-containing protein [Chloroflexi bacterium]|nr:TetR/AcrR family transcriptional regulator C-terminal domain-containing protein [Chloroflexota bacterium]